MDNSILFDLIGKAFNVDDIGQRVATETSRAVYGRMGSITRAEWGASLQNGFNPSFSITMFAYDYNGEELAEVDGVRYSIYRTYRYNDLIELYLEKKTGATNG